MARIKKAEESQGGLYDQAEQQKAQQVTQQDKASDIMLNLASTCSHSLAR